MAVDNRGHLFVRPAPLPEGVMATDTGEFLDLSRATKLGPLGQTIGNWPATAECAGGVCRSRIHVADGLVALAAGSETCVADAAAHTLTVELDTGTFRLRFDAERPNAVVPPGCPRGLPRHVAVGDAMSSFTSWQVSATAPDGSPLSVVADQVGRILYVGGITPTVTTCPCAAAGS